MEPFLTFWTPIYLLPTTTAFMDFFPIFLVHQSLQVGIELSR